MDKTPRCREVFEQLENRVNCIVLQNTVNVFVFVKCVNSKMTNKKHP